MGRVNIVKKSERSSQKLKEANDVVKITKVIQSNAISPKTIQTRSKRSLTTEKALDVRPEKRMRVASKSPKNGTKLHQKVATMKSNKSGEKPPNLPNATKGGLSEESQNNNATISQIPPVVGSTKSLIDSIKTIRAKTEHSEELNSPPRNRRAKIVEPTAPDSKTSC